MRIYISVDSLDAALEASKANGGSVASEPLDVPGQGRFATIHHSEGNTVSLWESAQS